MSDALAPALRLTRLSKRYREHAALSDVDLVLERGRLVGLLGANGSGKSTLLALCAGALVASSGHVRTLGFDPRRASARERGRIAFADQDVALDPEMTGRETFELMAALCQLSPARRAEERRWLEEALALGPVLSRRVATYSGGMRRRLHLGLSLLSNAELLLLDEPFVGLDAETRALVWSSLAARARQGATVVLSTHELFDAGERCAQVVVLSRGKLRAFGSPRELIERHAGSSRRPSLEQAVLALSEPSD